MALIIGKWDLKVTWFYGLGAGIEFKTDITFNADTTWNNRSGNTSRWLQIGDQVLWDFDKDARVRGLIYAGNVQSSHDRPSMTDEAFNDDTVPHESWMTGIMGSTDYSTNSGTFRAKRLIAGDVTAVSSGVPENNSDPLFGPVAATLADSSDRAAQRPS